MGTKRARFAQLMQKATLGRILTIGYDPAWLEVLLLPQSCFNTHAVPEPARSPSLGDCILTPSFGALARLDGCSLECLGLRELK